MSVRRWRWEELPAEVRAVVEDRYGTVLKAEASRGGIMPGVVARLCVQGGGSVFLKGIPADEPAARLYARERAAHLELAPGVPAPRMLWSTDIGGWLLHVFGTSMARGTLIFRLDRRICPACSMPCPV